MADDNVIPFNPDASGETRDRLIEAVEQQWIRLIEELSSDKAAVEGTDGSSAKALTIAERVRILTSATEFLLKLQKLKPSKSRSGISKLSDALRGDPGRTGRR